MKMKLITIALIVVAIGLGAYRVTTYIGKEGDDDQVIVTPVRVMTITPSTIEATMKYQGRVTPEFIEKISFKSTARLELFNGVTGDELQPGHVLAGLEASDLQLGLDAAQSQLDAAIANYEQAKKGARDEDVSLASLSTNKAQEAVDYLQGKVADMNSLYDSGVISLSELDGIKLDLTLAESDLSLARQNYIKAAGSAEVEVIEAARAQMAAATTNRDAQQSLLDDGVYAIEEPRILVQQLYEEGELVPAGYPVAVLRSLDQSVIVGVAAKDLPNIFIGQAVRIDGQNISTNGTIVRRSELPDESHFLYEVEIGLDEQSYMVGEIVDCDIIVGQYEGFTVPITSIMNDGIDYVILAVEGKATLRQIVIEDVMDGYAVVTGLESGDQMIVSNLNRIHENSVIEIEE